MLLSRVMDLTKVTRSEELPERIESILLNLKEAERSLMSVRVSQQIQTLLPLLAGSEKVGEVTWFARFIAGGLSGDELREISIALREKDASSVVALASERYGKIILVASVAPNARNRGVKAGLLVKGGSTVLGGGGGGKDDFAQGGGVKTEKIHEAFDVMRAEIAKSIQK
jgi:alanyl-tRNA synthetase